jgi:hypothetical protein
LDAVLAVFHEYVVVEQRGELQTGDDRLGGRAGEQRLGVRPEREKMLDCSVTDERVTPPPDTTIARA